MVARLSRIGAPIVYGQHTSMGEELPQWFPVPGVHAVGRLIDTLVPRLAHRSMALSEAGRQTLPADSEVHAPGVDLADLEGASAQRAVERYGLDSRPWVVYAGNIDPYQDVDLWLRAMRRVPQAGVLLVTGGDPTPLRRLASQLGLSACRVRVVGGASFEEMKDALVAARLAVCPRRLCRGFPIKLLNQLGLGVVTVCAPGSARDIDGVVRASDDSEEALAAAIRGLLDDPERIDTLSAAARQDVQRRWTWDARARDVVGMYRRLIAERR